MTEEWTWGVVGARKNLVGIDDAGHAERRLPLNFFLDRFRLVFHTFA